MAETETSSSSASSSARADFKRDMGAACGSLRDAVGKAADAFLPPDEVRRHFRQARVEVLKGFRELIDLRIARLNRGDSKGTRVVVE